MIKKFLYPLEDHPYQLPYLQVRARQAGPTVWLTGCLHGDEVGSIAIVHEVFKLATKQLSRGCLKAFPAVNRPGFKARTRLLGKNGDDLNRCFGFQQKRSLAHRLANYIQTTIERDQPELVIDIHNDWVNTVPYILLDSPALANEVALNKVKHFTAASDLIRVCDFNEDIRTARGTLSGALIANGHAAFTLEAGESFRVDENTVKTACKSIWAMLSLLQMSQPQNLTVKAHLQYPKDVWHSILQYSDQVVCKKSGLLRMRKNPGDFIKKNEPIAVIYDHLGNHIETLSNPVDSIVIGYADYAAVEVGAKPLALALL